MKKIYSLFFLLLFMAAGVVQAQNVKWTINEDNWLKEITPGMNVVLKEGPNTQNWSTGGYLNSGSGDVLSILTEECVWQFEEAGTSNGATTYYLKNVANNKYLSAGDDGSTTTYTSSKSLAFEFTAKLAVADSEDYTEAVNSEREPDAAGNCFVLCSTTEQIYIGFGGNPSWWSYKDTNCWYVYEAISQEKTGKDMLDEILSIKFPNGVTSTLFPVGTTPGCISQAAYDALENAYNNAIGLYEQGNPNDDACRSAAEELQTALDNVNASVVPVTAGYYHIVGGPNADRGIYDNGGVKWTTDFTPVTTADLSKASYIWKLIPSDNEGYFYVQNFGTSKYIGTASSYSVMLSSTENPEQEWTFHPTSTSTKGGIFDVINLEAGEGSSMNTDPSKVIVFWSTGSGDNSFFKLVPVDEAIVNEMQDAVLQQRLNSNLEETYINGLETYNKGRNFTPSEDATPDDQYDLPGVLTWNENEDDPNIWTNAPEANEGSNGPAYLLLDGDLSTYFHSNWSGNPATVTDKHFLQVNLDEAIQNVTFKYTKRNNNGGAPKIWTIMTSDSKDGPWVDQGRYTVSYQYPTTFPNGTVKENSTGVQAIIFDKPYQYIRLVNEISDTNKSFFHLSELRIYEGAVYDINCPYEKVDAAVRAELEKQLAAAKAEIAAEQATQATIDALKAAIDAFNEVYPDTTVISSLFTEIESLLSAAVEDDTKIGYYATGSVAELQAATDAARTKVTDHMTFEEIQVVKEELRAAIATFNSKLNMPVEGTLYYIVSKTGSEAETAAVNNVLYAAGNEEANIRWGYYDRETGTPDYEDRLNAYWILEKNEDDSYSIRNVATGYYLGNQPKFNVQVLLSKEKSSVNLRFARLAGAFNIVMAEEVYANTQPGTNRLVTWNSAEGADNSAFAFEPATDKFAYYRDVTANQPQIITLPFEITGVPNYGYCYKVLGQKDRNVQLMEYGQDEMIPAGTPFVYLSPSEDDVIEIFNTTEAADALTYNFEPALHNGLQGVLEPTTLTAEGMGILNGASATVVATEVGNEYRVSANTGFFRAIPATEIDGDYTLTIDGEITGIKNATVVKNENVNVYTLSGVMVRKNVKAGNAANGLPKGIYIIGSKKVVVK